MAGAELKRDTHARSNPGRDAIARDTEVRDSGAADRPTAPGSRAPVRRRRARAEDDNWDQRLGFLMHDVSRLRRAVFDEFMKPAGVTRSQWWILAHLSRRDGMIQSDLAEVLELGKAALGGLVDRLEAAGFVERRPDGADRRVKRIHLTVKGTRMVLKMRRQSDAMSERILHGLTAVQRRSLTGMLNLVKRNLVSIRDGGQLPP